MKQAGRGGGSQGMMNKKTGGPSAKHAAIQYRRGTKGDVFESRFSKLSQGGEHAQKMVMMNAVQGRGGKTQTNDDRAELFPWQTKMTTTAAQQRGDD
jgi:hypothetical protein